MLESQVAARARIDPVFIELVVDLVVTRFVGSAFIAAADHEHSNALFERAEWLGRLADLHRKHHLLERRGKVAGQKAEPQQLAAQLPGRPVGMRPTQPGQRELAGELAHLEGEPETPWPAELPAPTTITHRPLNDGASVVAAP
jgi:hypothetical protein